MRILKLLGVNALLVLTAALAAGASMSVVPLPGGGEPGTPSRAVGVVVFFSLYLSLTWVYQRRTPDSESPLPGQS